MIQKILFFLLGLFFCTPILTAVTTHLGIRIGVDAGYNHGIVRYQSSERQGDLRLKQLAGSFSGAILLDMGIIPNLNLRPGFHFNINRSTRGRLPNGEIISARWQEFSLDFLTIYHVGFWHFGLGPGATFHTRPRVTLPNDLSIEELSVQHNAIVVGEIGVNLPFMLGFIQLAWRSAFNISSVINYARVYQRGYLRNLIQNGLYLGLSFRLSERVLI